jgi:hypothetical protein
MVHPERLDRSSSPWSVGSAESANEARLSSGKPDEDGHATVK